MQLNSINNIRFRAIPEQEAETEVVTKPSFRANEANTLERTPEADTVEFSAKEEGENAEEVVEE